MDVKALVVGKGVLDAMVASPHLNASEPWDEAESIHRIGHYGQIPVYYDEALPNDKIIVAYTLSSGEGEPDPERVKHWRGELPNNPDGGDWVLLTDRRPPPGAFSYRRLGESETECRARRGAERAARSS